ncbi:MAG: efflux RND transporter periplasmic adaptor subunit [Patescibacteria group bacterium]|nr:efflux RND transporter periplasmic adaptor subunit [Patescibacteria group bacterium]MDD4304563.1 efflux RND transporter periplasmic adaptor subunit [Patescibacteria group bacterium]
MTKKKKIILTSLTIIIIMTIVVLVIFMKKPKIVYTTEAVQKSKLIQTVSETGTIKPADEIELNFQNIGKISKVNVKTGDKVTTDQILAELDYKDLSIRIKDANASLDIAKANLDKLKTGATSYAINVKQVSVDKAETEYKSALNELEEIKASVNEGSSQAETDALISMDTNISKAQIAIDNIKTILDDDDAEYLFGVKETGSLYKIETSYESSKNSIINTKISINKARSTKSRSDIKIALNKTIASINSTFNTLLDGYRMLENTITSSTFTQTQLDAHKSTVSAQQTIISTALSSTQTALDNLNDTELNNYGAISGSQQITNAQSKVDSYYSSWQLAKAQLEELKAPARNQDVSLYEAQVRQAQSNIESIRNQIENSIIRAPIDGIITDVAYKKGEQFSSTQPAIKMLSDGKLEIEVDISESDIIKVKNDDSVEISLDALSSDQKLYGIVYDINPAETVIQDVIYYKIKIAFDIPLELEENIKPGMTANVIIKTKEKDDVLIIPSRAIIDRNGDGQFIKILENNSPKEISIKTGIYGDNGMVEVISGLNENDQIITSSTENKK